MPSRPNPSRLSRFLPAITPLEDRTVPTALIGLTTSNQLVSFDSATPGTITSTVPVTGLATGQDLVGIDVRPSNGQLYAVSSDSRLFTVNTTTGAATAVGTAPFSTPLDGTSFGVDFNPAVDKLRIVSNTGQSLRVNADTGALVAVDAKLAYDPQSYDAAIGGTAPTPSVTSVAYTQNTNGANPAVVTTLYGIDSGTGALVTIGGPEGDPSPNLGTLFVVDKLAGFGASPALPDAPNSFIGGFEIVAGTDEAFATTGGGFTVTPTSTLYSINLTTAQTKSLGTLTGLKGLAVAPLATIISPGAGTIALSAPTAAFNAERQPLTLTVTRTGGTTGTATVNFATADGTAIAGSDYLPASGTLTFAPGETSKTITVLAVANPAAADAKTFTLTLSGPTVAALGAATATITLPSTITTPPTGGTSQRFLAVGTGAGVASVINVYDSATGVLRYALSPFEASFTGGVSVATADVNGDGVDDIIAGAGNGGGPRVVVFDGATKAVLANFFPYESTFRGGVNVAAGDVDGDGFADIVAGAGVGGGPRIVVLQGGPGLTDTNQTLLFNFFAYEDTFRGGVNVGVGEYNGDGKADILAGAGNGGGPRIEVFSGSNGAILTNFFAYEDTFRGGVFVASGNVNNDGVTDIIAGTGPGGGPRVLAFSGIPATGAQPTIVGNFFAFDQANRGGVRVTTTDLNNDGIDDIVAASGPGSANPVRIFTVAGGQLQQIQAFDAAFNGGINVG